ncbi:MAG: FecR family protein [Odoribacter splanchnicus]
MVDRINVEVLGTEFNITAYPEDPIIATTLNRGAVRISDGTQNLKLHPDQQAVFFKNNGMIECREVDAKIYSAWTEGRIVLRNVTLEELMNRISRWYDLRINWYDEEIKNYHFTGEMLRYEKFSEILSMLEKATSVHFNIIGNLIEIRKR